MLNTTTIDENIYKNENLELLSCMAAKTEISEISNAEATYNNLIHCYQGDPVFIYAGGSTYSFYDVDIRDIVITYGNK